MLNQASKYTKPGSTLAVITPGSRSFDGDGKIDTVIVGNPPFNNVHNYYMLLMVNHTTKEYFIRTEDTPGTGKHSLINFVDHARMRVSKQNYSKCWKIFKKRFEWLVASDKNQLEQTVMASVTATSSNEARKKMAELKNNYIEQIGKLGYTKIDS